MCHTKCSFILLTEGAKSKEAPQHALADKEKSQKHCDDNKEKLLTNGKEKLISNDNPNNKDHQKPKRGKGNP